MMRSVWALLVVALSACASGAGSSTPSASCLIGDIQLHAVFEGARAADCERLGPDSFRVRVSPEAEPINPSPWYAFDIVASHQAMATVTLRYAGSRHRYIPKKRAGGSVWTRLNREDVTEFDDGYGARFTVPVETGRTRIAAQELMPPSDRAAWVMALAERAGLQPRSLGTSVDDRRLLSLQAGACAPGLPLVIILGGQHPPEVPGVFGLRAFLETLLLSGPASAHFLESVCLLLVPELNPDGVARGHWRLNANLVDLNRDWGPFSQPETRAVRTEIERLQERGLAPALLLDFHATRRTVFYTPPDDMGLNPQNFARDWLARIEASWAGAMPDRSSNHNPGLPTAKAWMAQAHGAPGITVEFGDEADRDEIAALAKVAALMLMDMFAPPGIEEN